MSRATIAGVGMTGFLKPSETREYDELAEDAVRDALRDADLA